MTHEQTARIVKVCERIGWPKSSTNFLEWDKLACGWYWYGQPLTRQMSYAEDNAEAILEKHLRQWLIQKYGYLNFRFEKNWISLTTMGKRGALKLKLETHDDDYLDMLLMAVEQTLVREAKP